MRALNLSQKKERKEKKNRSQPIVWSLILPPADDEKNVFMVAFIFRIMTNLFYIPSHLLECIMVYQQANDMVMYKTS